MSRLLVGLCVVLFAACTSAEGPTSPASSIAVDTGSTSPDSSPSPADVAIDTLHLPDNQGRIEGLYTGKLILLKSVAITGSRTDPNIKWRADPLCKEGPCDVHLTSISGKYAVRLVYTEGKHLYRGQALRKDFYSCGSVSEDATAAFSLRAESSHLVEDVWTATALSGTVTYTSSAKSSTCPTSTEKYAIRMKLSKK